jgi:hypothetical protein
VCVWLWLRACRYGPNIFPEPPFAGFWALFFESFQDPILMILIAAAIVSFIVGLIHSPSDGWIDGTAIVIAILLVAFVTATNNYRKELQFRALRVDANAMVRVRVLRNGSDVPVAVADVVVGDVVHLETGDKVRARSTRRYYKSLCVYSFPALPSACNLRSSRVYALTGHCRRSVHLRVFSEDRRGCHHRRV